MRLHFVVMFVAGISSLLRGASFCTVTVSVHDSEGSPVATSVDLVDSIGNTAQMLWARGGEARLCDFGFGVYSILGAREKWSTFGSRAFQKWPAEWGRGSRTMLVRERTISSAPKARGWATAGDTPGQFS